MKKKILHILKKMNFVILTDWSIKKLKFLYFFQVLTRDLIQRYGGWCLVSVQKINFGIFFKFIKQGG